MRGRSRRPGKAMPKAMMAAKLMRAAAAPDMDEATPAAPLPPAQAVLQASRSPGTPVPVQPPSGATDGLGAGQGGLALHPSTKGLNIHGYEPRHTSRTR